MSARPETKRICWGVIVGSMLRVQYPRRIREHETYIAQCQKSPVKQEHNTQEHEESSKCRQRDTDFCKQYTYW
jgi:hypothetical protein